MKKYDRIGTTSSGYSVYAIPSGASSPMQAHRGGEIAVDEIGKRYFVWAVFAVTYGIETILAACEKYETKHEATKP